MTTAMYFFLMGVTLFVLPQLLVKVFTKEVKIDSKTIYLIAAGLLPMFWIFVPRVYVSLREVNFLQHAIGGGVAVGLVGFYLIESLKNTFPVLQKFPAQIIFTYLLVSGFGVANEILEFLLDYLGVGIFSADRYDTWFDLVANSTGAISVFLLIILFKGLFKRKN